jgi:vacuolar-type H+-ATPase subunit H
VRRRDDDPAPPPFATSTAERLAAIVEAAERAAVTVIDDAEEQARRRLEEAQVEADRLVADRIASLADLTDSLIAEAEAIRSQSERLAFSLQEARRRLGAEDPGTGRSEPFELSRPSHLTAVDPVEERVVEEPTTLRPAAGEPGTPAGARLLATQMAVSGNSREEIEAKLRNGFDIEDTAPILDAILGPED